MTYKKLILLIAFPMIMLSCQASNEQWYTNEQLEKEVGKCDYEPCMNVHIDYLVFSDLFPNHIALNEELQRMIGQFLVIDGKAVPKSLKKSVEAFESSFKDFAKSIGEGASRQYIATGASEISLDSENLKSIIVQMDLYTGGANGMNFFDALNVNSKTGKVLQISELITDLNEFELLAEMAFRNQFDIALETPFTETSYFMEGSFFLSNKIAFTEDSIVLLYDKYEAAVGAMGPLKVFIPLSAVQHLIPYEYQF